MARLRSVHPERTLLPVLMWVLLAAYLAGLTGSGTGVEPLFSGGLGVGAQLVPVAICWLAVRGAGVRRAEVACLAVGVTSFTLGNVLSVLALARGGTLPFPSAGDLGYLCFYPAALAAIVLAVRREHRQLPGAVWLDSVLGGLGAATVLSVLLAGVFAQAAGSPVQVAVSLAYPIGDLLLAAAAVGVLALQGRRLQRHWLAMVVGLAIFAAADIIYALRIARGAYTVGTPLDGLWAVGLATLTLWTRPRAAPSRTEPAQEQTVALAVPALATAASLVVLNAATHMSVPVVAGTLATITLVATATRTQLAFRQLRRLAVLRRQATTDDLTGLPNRRAFYALVGAQLARGDVPRALLLMDLDKFKEVNDSLGHHIGDQLLVQVGQRLSTQLRGHDLLARLGGDEFAVLLEATDREQAAATAVKLRDALAVPLTLEGIAVRTGVSIGVALAPEHGTDLSLLLRRADIAMYKAKHAQDGHRIFDGARDSSGDDRLRTLHELRLALDQGQLVLHYQPKVDLRTGQVPGVKALVRWDHPTRGLLYPDRFLALVEDAGLMRELTQAVLVQALGQAASWHADGRLLTVAVNLSASSLVDSDLPEQVAALLRARQLTATALQLEITEEFLMTDRDRARSILHRLRDLGVQIAVDDFGTGYSSLAYLRELPLDELKLDRSFVFPMADDARAAALVISTIGLAHSLGLRMVAEGVENAATLTELALHGCDQAQGHHLSRPVPAAELDHWLDQRRQDQYR